jgi:NAD(P)-dependent dehydrogenase (short-subunit alcohol dehydrogenase family)
MAIAGSLAEPELLTRAICYLADYDAARHINGVIVPVDGGWSVM